MRDLDPDWKRSSRAERGSCVAFGATFIMLALIAILTNYDPLVGRAAVHQAQASVFFSDEDRFLNSVMVRAYNAGDTESLRELLQYWEDAHTPAL